MRRIISVLAVVAVVAAMVAVMAMPAFAAPREGAGCVGEALSSAEPGTKGEVVRAEAQTGKVGESISSVANGDRTTSCIL